MAQVLELCGFTNIELLNSYLSEILFTPAPELNNLWIYHINKSNAPTIDSADDESTESYSSLVSAVNTRAAGSLAEIPDRLRPASLVEPVYRASNLKVATYIFTQCHIFYNWGLDAFEPLLNSLQVYEAIHRKFKERPPGKTRRISLRQLRASSTFGASDSRQSSDAFRDESRTSEPKKFSRLKLEAIYKACNTPVWNITKDENNPLQQKFTLNPILYCLYQQANWPQKSPLCSFCPERLMKHVVNVKIASVDFVGVLEEYSRDWSTLKDILKYFCKKNEELSKNDGYRRVLKHHLKDWQDGSSLRYCEVPKQKVCSFVVDILRRVMPMSFFGCNNLRKRFFAEVIHVVNGCKGQQFIWLPLVLQFIQRIRSLPWCMDFQDGFVTNTMILKLVIFLVKDFVFLLLKRYFYITESGSCGFALSYFLKSDYESMVDVTLNNMLFYKQLRLMKSKTKEISSIERTWRDTGVLDIEKLKLGERVFISSNDFRQPVADVRFMPKTPGAQDMRMITRLKPTRTTVHKHETKKRKLLKIFNARFMKAQHKINKLKKVLEYLVASEGTGVKPLPSNPHIEAAWAKASYLKDAYGSLYFVKADIADAFGSVNHLKLAEVITRYFNQSCKHLRLKKVLEWKCVRGGLTLRKRYTFSDVARERSVMLGRFRVGSKNKAFRGSLDDLKAVLHQIVFKQRLRIKNRVYVLRGGLAQGGVGKLSSLLCELYYSALDRQVFGGLLNTDNTVFLRGVDDYLVLSSDRAVAQFVNDVVVNGVEAFNTRFSSNKLLTNLTTEVSTVPYLGLLLDVSNLTVVPDFSRYNHKTLLATMQLSDTSGDIHFNKTAWLGRRALRITALKLYPILLKNQHNDISLLRQIIFDASLMQACRVHTMAKYLFNIFTQNSMDLMVVVNKGINKISRLVQQSTTQITYEEIKWIGLYAHLLVFKRSPGQFKQLLTLLEHKFYIAGNYFHRHGMSSLLDFIHQDVKFQLKWHGVKETFKHLSHASKF